MRNCMQSSTQNMLQHGFSVWKHTYQLLKFDDQTNFRLPQWYIKYKSLLLENIHSFKTIKHYTLFHDAGKPFSLEIDEMGKKHFPDHANVSADVFKKYIRDDETIIRLIKNDMIMHAKKYDEIISMKLSIKDISTHLIVALAELHANAELFGGIESESFKIKFKRLEKLGKKLCYQLFDHSYMYVIIRNDLNNAQKAVQGMHAAIESTREFIKPDHIHPSLVLCIVKNESKLKKVIQELHDNKIKIKTFREPDLNDSITAIATEPLVGAKRNLLSRFQLLV